MKVMSRKFLIAIVIAGVLFQAMPVLAIPADSLPEPDESPPRVEITPQTPPRKQTSPDDDLVEQCLAEYQKKQHQSAIALCTRALSINPNHARAFLFRAYASEGIGNYQDAINDYTSARTILPWGDLYFSVHLYRGKANFWAGKYDEALLDLSFYLQKKSDKEGFFWRGRANLSSGKYDAAVADFNQVINTSDDFPSAYRWRGDAYNAIRKYDMAIADYSTYLADPRNEKWFPIALVNRAISYWWKDRGDLAEKDFIEAIRLDPNYAYAHLTYGDFLIYYARGLANSVEQKENFVRISNAAIAQYTEVIRIQPQNVRAYNSRAYSYGMLGRYSEALSDASTSFEKSNPKFFGAAFNVAQALEKQGKKEAAMKWYEYSKSILPGSAFERTRQKIAARLSGDWSSFREWL